MYANVVVPLPLPPLTYSVPSGMAVSRGAPVTIRLRNKVIHGVVVEMHDTLKEDAKFQVKEILGISSALPALSDETLKMLKWAADYYHYPMGEVFRTFLPPNPEPIKKTRFKLTDTGRALWDQGMRPKGKSQLAIFSRARENPSIEANPKERASFKRLVEIGHLEEFSVPDDEMDQPIAKLQAPPPLTRHQGEAISRLDASLDDGKFNTFLLQGITGSGKTEVYLRAAEGALRRGKSVLVVVPEIALTPQLVGRFRSRLGEKIALLHSGMSDKERSRQWHMLNRGSIKVCVGARSASMAPMLDLGLIVIDEEHESALKQEDHLKYNARDLAIVRAKNSSATIILGSATPSLESFHNCTIGRYQHIILPERPGGKPLPQVKIIDCSKTKMEGSFSINLTLAIKNSLAQKGQVMLLLNRRGFSSFLLCESCGYVPECPNCSVSLTNYKGASQLRCHYCGYTDTTPESCEKCHAKSLSPGTLGTESLEEEVKKLFPESKVLRIDRESTERKGALESALTSISNREVDIVIGTQIIAKGHDFPNISLVGVINADSSFHLPDFRASEKSFQLFTQMAGRAGRGERPGHVVIQTFNPNHPSIVHATKHDFRGFAEEELRFRHDLEYPPYSRLARLTLSAPSSSEAESDALTMVTALNKIPVGPKVDLVGPAPAVLTKIQNRYRWTVLLRSKSTRSLHTLLDFACANASRLIGKRTLLQVDVDPVSLM